MLCKRGTPPSTVAFDLSHGKRFKKTSKYEFKLVKRVETDYIKKERQAASTTTTTKNKKKNNFGKYT